MTVDIFFFLFGINRTVNRIVVSFNNRNSIELIYVSNIECINLSNRSVVKLCKSHIFSLRNNLTVTSDRCLNSNMTSHLRQPLTYSRVFHAMI